MPLKHLLSFQPLTKYSDIRMMMMILIFTCPRFQCILPFGKSFSRYNFNAIDKYTQILYNLLYRFSVLSVMRIISLNQYRLIHSQF